MVKRLDLHLPCQCSSNSLFYGHALAWTMNGWQIWHWPLCFQVSIHSTYSTNGICPACPIEIIVWNQTMARKVIWRVLCAMQYHLEPWDWKLSDLFLSFSSLSLEFCFSLWAFHSFGTGYVTETGTVSSVQFSHSVVSESLWPHESQHTRPPCPSPHLRVHSNLYLSSWWCHPAI